MKKNKFLLFFGIILLIGFFLRFYKLGGVPNGFYQDESAIGYNAYSIIKTGKDEYGKSLPLYFKSFGDYKLPVYIYSVIPSIQLFGMNEFAVRFPSAFFGLITLIFFYLFIKELTDDKKLALLAAGFLAINPWHLHYNRATFEVSISLFLFVAGALFLLKAFNKKIWGAFLVGTAFFIICVYSYNLTRLLAPLLYGLFIFIFRKKLMNVSRNEKILTVIVSLIFLLPFVITLLKDGGAGSASGTLLFSSAAVKAPLLEMRSYFIDFPSFFAKLFFNTNLQFFWQYVNNVASYFSAAFFFVSGSGHGNHGIGNVGQFYLFEFPLMILGIIGIIKKKKGWGILLFVWSSIVILTASLTRDIPHATRSFFLIVPFEIFSAVGLIYFFELIKNTTKKNLQIPIFLLVGAFCFYNIIYYFSSYYVRFPTLYAKSWRLEDKAVSEYIAKNSKYKKVIFDTDAGFIYTSYLFFAKYNPADFQATVLREKDDDEGFSKVNSFGKFEFRKIDWGKDIKIPDGLIVTTTNNKPLEVPPLKTFFYPMRPVAFSLKQQIIEYPIEEPAYVLVETH